jgi:hypothetical protein
MIAFAGNSLLCRVALKARASTQRHSGGAHRLRGLALWLIVRLRDGAHPVAGLAFGAGAVRVCTGPCV